MSEVNESAKPDQPEGHPLCPRCELENSPWTYHGVPVREMHAYPLELAARLIGVTYQTLHKWIEMDEIRMSPGKLISRVELERFLAKDGRKRRKKRTKAAENVT